MTITIIYTAVFYCHNMPATTSNVVTENRPAWVGNNFLEQTQLQRTALEVTTNEWFQYSESNSKHTRTRPMAQ